jgi:hypothetical protein
VTNSIKIINKRQYYVIFTIRHKYDIILSRDIVSNNTNFIKKGGGFMYKVVNELIKKYLM